METPEDGSSPIGNKKYQQYFIDHVSEFRQLDPFFCECSLSDDEIKEVLREAYDNVKIYNITSVINSTRTLHYPTAVWIAIDDTNVDYYSAKKVIDTANNNASNPRSWLRTMPNGTGGHASVDSGDADHGL